MFMLSSAMVIDIRGNVMYIVTARYFMFDTSIVNKILKEKSCVCESL